MADSDNHSSLWFFAVLAVLGAAAVIIPIVYNLGLQLNLEQIEQARSRWRASGPADYDLDYQQKYTHGGATDETAYRVIVRDRHIRAVVCDDQLTLLAGPAAGLALGPWTRALPGKCGALDMDGMYDYIESHLHQDAALPRRPFATATIDRKDGHLTRYVRRTGGGAERLEWTVKLTPSGR